MTAGVTGCRLRRESVRGRGSPHLAADRCFYGQTLFIQAEIYRRAGKTEIANSIETLAGEEGMRQRSDRKKNDRLAYKAKWQRDKRRREREKKMAYAARKAVQAVSTEATKSNIKSVVSCRRHTDRDMKKIIRRTSGKMPFLPDNDRCHVCGWIHSSDLLAWRSPDGKLQFLFRRCSAAVRVLRRLHHNSEMIANGNYPVESLPMFKKVSAVEAKNALRSHGILVYRHFYARTGGGRGRGRGVPVLRTDFQRS